MTLLYFANVLKNCPIDKIKKPGLSGHVYDFSVKSVLMLMFFFFFLIFIIKKNNEKRNTIENNV